MKKNKESNKELFLAIIGSGTLGAIFGNAVSGLDTQHFIWIGMGIIGIGFIYQWIKGGL